MADQIHLQIVTADGVVYDRMVREITVPLDVGSIGILANHAPLMGAVSDGVVTCGFEDGEDAVAVGLGVVNVAQNEVTVLVRTAEPGEAVDLARAEAAERRARERLEGKAVDLDTARAEAALHRAIARQRAAHMAKKENSARPGRLK